MPKEARFANHRSSKKYRKRSLVVDALIYIGGTRSADCVRHFVGADNFHLEKYKDGEGTGMFAVIKTLEGSMTVQPGDYIIKGIAGEFYPCKPKIFEQTYSEVRDERDNGLNKNCAESLVSLFSRKMCIPLAGLADSMAKGIDANGELSLSRGATTVLLLSFGRLFREVEHGTIPSSDREVSLCRRLEQESKRADGCSEDFQRLFQKYIRLLRQNKDLSNELGRKYEEPKDDHKFSSHKDFYNAAIKLVNEQLIQEGNKDHAKD